MATDPITYYVDQDSKRLETREWHLWYLAFALILFLGSLTIATYLFLLEDSMMDMGLSHITASRALYGLCVLIFLFCAYVVHTRITFGTMRGIIQKQATHDDLTNLYNRRMFNLRMSEEIARSDRDQYNLAILLCDIDHFKAINDSQGHQMGDKILKATARSIQESTRGTDMVFRWGGDEFVIVLLDTTREGILIAAERIRKGILKIAREGQVGIDISIGVAIYPEHGRNAEELMSLSDRALYIAKRGGDKIQIGDEEYHLDERAVKLVYQPVVDVWSDQILGYEALGRDPQGRFDIQTLFKRYQAIGRLSELKRICLRSTIRKADELGLRRIFINIDFNVLSRVEPIPKPPDLEIILEISEAEVLEDIEEHLEVVSRWREKNYQFAIDDFGAGFISLPFIARLIPDYIKLDRSTLLHAVASVQFKGFLKKLLPVLRTYAAEGIIAEGIETATELDVVKDLGVFIVQGFLLGKPQELGRSVNPIT
jgi:diguanylate cyclase (GGDEF)-like protein